LSGRQFLLDEANRAKAAFRGRKRVLPDPEWPIFPYASRGWVVPRLGETGWNASRLQFGSGSGAAEALFGAGGVFERFDGDDVAGEDGNGDHLGDFFAGIEFERVFAEVGHEDEDFAAVAGVDDAGGGGDAFGGHGRAVADEQAEGLAGGGVVGFNGDAGADADGGSGRERGRLQGEEVVAEVFAGVGDLGGAGSGVKEFYTKHASMLEHGGGRVAAGEYSRPKLYGGDNYFDSGPSIEMGRSK